MGLAWGCSTKESTCQWRKCKRHGFPGLGRSPGVGNSNLLQYSCLRNEQRRLAAYSPYSHKESDTSEQLRTHILAHLYSLRLWVEEDHWIFSPSPDNHSFPLWFFGHKVVYGRTKHGERGWLPPGGRSGELSTKPCNQLQAEYIYKCFPLWGLAKTSNFLFQLPCASANPSCCSE